MESMTYFWLPKVLMSLLFFYYLLLTLTQFVGVKSPLKSLAIMSFLLPFLFLLSSFFTDSWNVMGVSLSLFSLSDGIFCLAFSLVFSFLVAVFGKVSEDTREQKALQRIVFKIPLLGLIVLFISQGKIAWLSVLTWAILNLLLLMFFRQRRFISRLPYRYCVCLSLFGGAAVLLEKLWSPNMFSLALLLIYVYFWGRLLNYAMIKMMVSNQLTEVEHA